MTEPKKTVHPLASVGGIAGAAGGWLLSRYCGAYIWIPGIAAILLLLLFTKTPLRPKFFVGAITVTGAHVVWFIAGSAVTGAWAATAFDVVALSLGIVWLWLQPGLAAAIYLGLVQLASLGLNVLSLSAVTYGEPTHRALTAHCVFRLAALICLVVGYLHLRRERTAVVTFDPATTMQ